MPDPTDVAEQLAASIAGAGTPEYKPVEIQQQATPQTPAAAKPDPVAPAAATPTAAVDGQPAAGEPKPAEKGEGWSKKGAITPQAEASKPADRTPEELAEIARRDALGLSQTEPDSPAVIRKRYEESSREAHRLVNEAKSVKKILADAGIELAKANDGKLFLKPTDKHAEELKIDGEVDQIYSSLTDSEKALVDSDQKEFAKVIAKKVALALHAKRPSVQVPQGIEEAELDETNVAGAFDALFNAKTREGKSRFPEAETPEIQGHMRMLYDDPRFASMRKWMNVSKENFSIGLEMLHNRVAYALAPIRAAQKDADEQRKKEIEKQRKAVATGGGSPAGTPAGAKTGPLTPEEHADRIANATYR